jgi:hypothetical protein
MYTNRLGHLGVKPLINFFKVYYYICVFSSLPCHFILSLTFPRSYIFWYVHDSATCCQNIRACLKSCSEIPCYRKHLHCTCILTETIKFTRKNVQDCKKSNHNITISYIWSRQTAAWWFFSKFLISTIFSIVYALLLQKHIQ